MASSSKPYSLQLAERIHNTTGKDQLGRICSAGFILESSWHLVVERRFMNTPPQVVKKALLRAGFFWTVLYFGTDQALKWAEGKVKKAEEGRS
ncbi:hypothetical protein F5Y00DRAFT_223786 [Daldinia vernicosa]|uniref:uncharacterized protein n=1 Tax=Daldinia vernicosa TaxID=114800 RepID=UPI002007D9BE|nr:uncharacterized protein F5Y00DRAFT_223786 [Daldinia vernicosa]KAI0853835.1 hypothetical protein F5Y00DRAFT_223786 [Daldinia vernicosa]